jgi:hypothetical protein
VSDAQIDAWWRIRQRNLEKIVAKLLETEKAPHKLIEDWLAKSSDPNLVEQSIESTQKLVDWMDDHWRA